MIRLTVIWLTVPADTVDDMVDSYKYPTSPTPGESYPDFFITESPFTVVGGASTPSQEG